MGVSIADEDDDNCRMVRELAFLKYVYSLMEITVI
jgi:hypothetical protein